LDVLLEYPLRVEERTVKRNVIAATMPPTIGFSEIIHRSGSLSAKAAQA
jgi:hypothetical protein